MATDQQPRRLTLEERLAEAARKKTSGRAAKQAPSPASPASPQASGTIKGVDVEKGASSGAHCQTGAETESDGPILPEGYATMPPEEAEAFVASRMETKVASRVAKGVQEGLKPLRDEIALLKAQLEAQEANSSKKKVTGDMEAKLKQKDAQIEELMKEGIALSKKELTLNQSIKRLKKHEQELEEELEGLEQTVATLQGKCDALEVQVESNSSADRQLKEERAQVQTLKERNEALVLANEGLLQDVKEFKMSNLEVQLEESKKECEMERERCSKLEMEVTQIHNELTTFKSTKLSLINTLESENDKLRQQLENAALDNEREIKRLEDKMESLRFQSENAPATHSNRDIEIIQAQLDQSQENWKLIESSYLKKMQTFENEIEDLKGENVTICKKNKHLANEIKAKATENQAMQDRELNLQNQVATLTAQTKALETQVSTLTASLEALTKDYETEKVSFEAKLRQAEEEKMQLPEPMKNDFGSNFYLQDLASSTSSFNRGPMANTPNKKFAIAFGESSTTPRPGSYSRLNSISEFTSMVSPQEKVLAHQSSMMSFDMDNEPLGIQSSSFRHASASADDMDELRMGAEANDTGSDRASTLAGHRNSNAGMGSATQHIQLIKKLSSNVNRLEMELTTMREEAAKLAEERERAQDEIVRLLDQVKQSHTLETQMAEKDALVASLENKLDKALVLLGKKEERVGELGADVDDLKDMLKQQVQQMVEMQMQLNER